MIRRTAIGHAVALTTLAAASAQPFPGMAQSPGLRDTSTTGNAAVDPRTLDAEPLPAKTGGVYWITLSGKFAQDITQTPIRQSFEDARRYRPDIVVIEIDNAVEIPAAGRELTPELEKLYENFDELFRAEKFLTVPTEEVPAAWGYSPRIVYWVKRALGGIAFMPLSGKEVYFAPEGKLGGVGDLDLILLQGHERVVQKQRSLRLQHAVGWVNHSGFPQPDELTRALVLDSAVMSVRFVNGQPQLVEGHPSNPGEELLTDDGKGANADTIYQLARGLGNDVLTLNERTAKLLGLSKGTVSTRQELLAALGVADDALIDGRSDRIMKDWSVGIQNAYASLRRLSREYADIQIQGDFNERRAARAKAIAKLEQIKSLATRWNEGFDPYQIAELGLPPTQDGLDIPRIQQAIDRLRLEQTLDRR